MKFTLFLVTVFLAIVSRVAGVDTTNAFPHLRYAPVDIRVVDASTSRPLAGALVAPFCLGGTPHGTNTYRTDTNGFVKAMFIDGGMVALRVTMDGYQTSNIALLETNRIVSMRKSQ
jgi:hypothetical protein